MTTESKGCECHRCIKERRLGSMLCGIFLPLSATKLIVCPKCGNKRCPHASDHDLECTSSNDPGQHGSIYEVV
jgi:uncharacterized Zn-finger protein